MNIYINISNRDALLEEINKSGLINSLLEKHYRESTPVVSPQNMGVTPGHLKTVTGTLEHPKPAKPVSYKPTSSWGA